MSANVVSERPQVGVEKHTPEPAATAMSGPVLGNPGPLGLSAFALTTFFLSIFGFLLITFILPGIGNAGHHITMVHWGGYFGLLTAAAAGYTALAEVTNDTFGRTVMPI